MVFAVLSLSVFLSAETGRQTLPAEGLAKSLRRLEASNAPFSRGVSAFKEGRLETAEAEFKACLAKFEDQAYAYYYLANIRYVRKDFAAALAAMDEAVSRFDAMTALSARSEQRRSEDRDALRITLKAVGENRMTCKDRRAIELDQDALEDAAFASEKAAARRAEMSARLKAHFIYFRGNALFQLRRVPEAFHSYEEAVRLDPLHADAVNNLVAILYVAREYAKALAVFERAEAAGLEESLNLTLKEQLFKAAGKPTEGILAEDLMAGQDPARLAIRRFALAFCPAPEAGRVLYVNAYVAFDPSTKDAVLIDPGVTDVRIEEFINANGLRVTAILLTHAHADHSGASRSYANRLRVPVYGPRAEARSFKDPLDRVMGDGDHMEIGGPAVRCVEIAGHTAGGLCYVINGVVFSGDTLLRNDIGALRADSAKERDRARKAMVQGIRDKILGLPDGTLVCPGHGKTTTVGAERANNPALAR
jgi:hydroxyacylglutathione hydrolase